MNYFSNELFQFFAELKKNNDRAWFLKNKRRYEEHVKEPLLAFIEEVGPQLRKISSNIVADPRPVGGSLFRIHRDVRFSKDKSPYKTHAGVHFPLGGKGAHSPGYYLHLEPGGSFIAAGMWMPEAPALQRIRERIASHPQEWKKVRSQLDETDEMLVRPPKSFDPDHPLIADIKLKTFTSSEMLTEDEVCRPDFMKTFVGHCKGKAPFMKFLAGAVGSPW